MDLLSQYFAYGGRAACSLRFVLQPAMNHCKVSFRPYSSGSFRDRHCGFTSKANCSLRARWSSGSVGIVYGSGTDNSSTDGDERWLLEPVGDGDSRHIGYAVQMPGSFEIMSDVVTVGRLPDKADMVIPVATVSARHAMLKKKGGSLLVTDLDSTNGTFIDQIKLRPGSVATVEPGSFIIFGDEHLAMFRVSKLEVVNTKETSEDPEDSDEP